VSESPDRATERPDGCRDIADADRRRLIRGVAGITVLALAPFQIARGATLLGVRVWPAPDYTRVTLEHDGELTFNQFMIRDSGPLRLVLDIDGIDLTPTLKDLVGKIEPDDPYIKAVRIGQNRPKVVRLVLELKVDVKPQLFAVDAVGPYQRRLVLDLFPAVPIDPIMALLEPQTPPEPAPVPQPPAVEAQPPAANNKPAPETASSSSPSSSSPSSHAERTPAPSADTTPVPSANEEPAPSGGPRNPSSRNRYSRVLTIAIDPGHGGEDPGAIGRRGTYEKTVTLSIGQRLAALIEEQQNLRVLMTRDADFFVPLGMRVQKARRVQADLFVSIHADAWIKPTARGSSVFALSERGATSSAAAWLAQRQNEADQIGGANLGAHDENIARVLLDLSTTAQINDSLRFGAAMLRELGHVNQLHKDQVEQASFAVLKAPDIPSILVETAFISNPDEEVRLRENGYQAQMAKALLNGITHYFSKHPPPPHNAIG
jgi:N-acetylmuramoyl-L-alanine amidase